MGANIETTPANNIIIALVQMKNIDEFECAFSAAMLYDLFNVMTMALLLPFEALIEYLEIVTKLIVDRAEMRKGKDWEGPMEKLVKSFTKKLIIYNKKAIIAVAKGEFYPISCVDGLPQSASTSHTRFVACNKHTSDYPDWF
jgi:hypothetical protein